MTLEPLLRISFLPRSPAMLSRFTGQLRRNGLPVSVRSPKCPQDTVPDVGRNVGWNKCFEKPLA